MNGIMKCCPDPNGIVKRNDFSCSSTNYNGASDFNAIFTPLTFLFSYFNSGVNPILYAFLSRNFRKGMRELLFCSMKKTWAHSSTKHRMPTQVSVMFCRVTGGRAIEGSWV